MTDKNDIEQLFKEHFGRMYSLAMALLHDDELAADIVQDVFASVLEKDMNFSASAAYLLNAVRNRCLNYIRDCEIHQRIMAAYFLENEGGEPNMLPDDEKFSRIRDLISSELSPQAQRIIQLRFYGGMPFAEIAAEMGISETAVYRHLRHALILIRQKLNQNG